MAASSSRTAVASKICPLCSFRTLSVPGVLSHLRCVHSHDPHFLVTCGLKGCATTSRSFSALYSHIYRKHPDVITRRKPVMVHQPENPGSSQAGGELLNFEPIIEDAGMWHFYFCLVRLGGNKCAF